MARTPARSGASVSTAPRGGGVDDALDAAPWSGWDDVAVDGPVDAPVEPTPSRTEAEDTPEVEEAPELEKAPAEDPAARKTATTKAPKKAAPKKAAPKKAGKGKAAEGKAHADPAARRFRVVAVTAVVLVVAALAAAVTAGVFFVQGRTLEANREAALTAGRQAAINLVSVNGETADADVRRVLDGATGEFAQLFSQNIDSYTGIVREGKVVSTGEVAGIGVERVDGESARVLAAVNSKVKNNQLPDGEARNYRMAMDMVLGEDGVWRVAKMEFIP